MMFVHRNAGSTAGVAMQFVATAQPT